WRQRELGLGLSPEVPAERRVEQGFAAFSDEGPPPDFQVPWRVLRDLVALFSAESAGWFLEDRSRLEAFGDEAERAARDQVACEACSGTGEVEPEATMFHSLPRPATCTDCSGTGYNVKRDPS